MDATRPGVVLVRTADALFTMSTEGWRKRTSLNSPPLDQGQSSSSALDLFDSVEMSVSTRKRAS